MNGIRLTNQVSHACFDIPHKLQKKLHFFQLPYLEHDFMITNLVRLNLIF